MGRGHVWAAAVGMLACGMAWAAPAGAPPEVPKGIWVRPGYELTVAQADLRNPRFMVVDPAGVLYVSLPQQGQIKSCRDTDGDGVYDKAETFVEGHPTVHGMFWHNGWLWFAESAAIRRARDTNGDGRAEETVRDVITTGKIVQRGGHWWRSILIHGGRIYTGIGDPGNITDQRDTLREKIWSYDLTGKDEKLFCGGLRNTEKLVVRPGTEEIWGMDHGSDWFGRTLEDKAQAGQPITDLNPPDEMNRYVEGAFYGHPFIVGNRVVRYEFIDRPAEMAELAAKTTPPEWCTKAHWAPNAMVFYTGEQFPAAKGDAFVTYHGSWNRAEKAGYCVTRVLFEDGHLYGEQVYVSFLAKDGAVAARPVDVVQAPDGSLLISDDEGSRIYRLRYVGGGKGT